MYSAYIYPLTPWTHLLAVLGTWWWVEESHGSACLLSDFNVSVYSHTLLQTLGYSCSTVWHCYAVKCMMHTHDICQKECKLIDWCGCICTASVWALMVTTHALWVYCIDSRNSQGREFENYSTCMVRPQLLIHHTFTACMYILYYIHYIRMLHVAIAHSPCTQCMQIHHTYQSLHNTNTMHMHVS